MAKKRNKDLNVPTLRFPEFDKEWENTSLSTIGDFIGGGTPSSKNEAYWNGVIPWISSSDISENNIYEIKKNRFITNEAVNNSATKICPALSILIVSRVGVGKVALSQTEICTSQDFTNITNIKGDEVFFAYLVSKLMKRLSSNTQGTSIKGITSSEIKSQQIRFPKEIEEQKKIAKILTLLDIRIKTQNKIIEELKLLKSTLCEMLYSRFEENYETETCIGDLIEYLQPNKFLVLGNEYSKDQKLIPVLTANKSFILGYTEDTEGICSIGDCIIFDDFTMDMKFVNFPFKVKSSAIKILKPKPSSNIRFLYYYLKYLNLNSSGHKRHYISEIEPLKLKLPNITKQLKISKTMKAVDDKIAVENDILINHSKQKDYFLRNLF